MLSLGSVMPRCRRVFLNEKVEVVHHLTYKVVNHRFRSHLEWTSGQNITILAIKVTFTVALKEIRKTNVMYFQA